MNALPDDGSNAPRSGIDPGRQEWFAEPWIADDMRWFGAHPEAHYRVRELHPAEAASLQERGELGMPAGAESFLAGRDSWHAMLVIQVRSGFRVRTPIVIRSWAPLTNVVVEDGQVVPIDEYISALRRAIDVAETGAA